MTTTADFNTVAPTTGLHRIGRIVRLHFTNPWSTLTLPWIILSVIFVANLIIWALIYWSVTNAGDRADVADGMQYSGSTSYIFVYMLIVAMQSIAVTFPFALGYGITRRDYYLGTAVFFIILAAIYSVGLALLGILERATGGWGMGGRMFTAVYFGDNPLQNLYTFFIGMIFFLFVGAFFASIWVRWKANGIVFTFLALGLVVVGLIALFSLTDSWSGVGSFFAQAGFVGTISWSLVISALAGLAGFRILRRATPRS